MSLFQSSRAQAFKPHVHEASDRCPLCEQPIAQDLVRRIETKRSEQLRTALEQARAEAEAALPQLVAEARAQERQTVEAGLAAKVAEVQAKLAQMEEAKVAAQDEMTALKAAQEAAVERRVAEIQESLQRKADDAQREKDAAVLAERTKAFEDQQKLQAKLQDLQRQLEKKSAHELGEGSEIDLFEQLKSAFEGDRIVRVGKGVNGADVIHEVMHNGRACGKIVYDAKNRNAWQNEFVTKLRADKIAQGADHAILSSNKFPKDTAHVHYQDGVIVAAPARVIAIARLLRDQVVRMHELRISKEGRDRKSVELYAFITSEHCKALLDQEIGRASCR